jgi:hypothetical protein
MKQFLKITMFIGTVYQQPLSQCAPSIFIYNMGLQPVAQLELYGPRPHLWIIIIIIIIIIIHCNWFFTQLQQSLH